MFQKPVVLLTGFYVFRQRILGNTALVSNNVFLLSFVMISSVASKSQDFKVGMPVFKPFYEMKLKTFKFKVLTFRSQ